MFAHSAATIFPLALLAGIGNALQRPALRSALPVVAGDDAQIAAALYDTSRWVGVTLGPALAAGLFALWGVGLPLALNALSFVVAAAVLVTVPMERPPAAPRGGGPASRTPRSRAAGSVPASPSRSPSPGSPL